MLGNILGAMTTVQHQEAALKHAYNMNKRQAMLRAMQNTISPYAGMYITEGKTDIPQVARNG